MEGETKKGKMRVSHNLLVKASIDSIIPQLSNTVLGLLGVSSGTYTALKTT